MAIEQPAFSIGFMTASVDLSAEQFKCVAVSGNGTVATQGGAGESVLGVLQNKPLSGAAANIMCLGVTKLLVGTGDLAAGANWQADADGLGITAATGDYVGGVVLIGASAGEYATVTVGNIGGMVN